MCTGGPSFFGGGIDFFLTFLLKVGEKETNDG